MTTVTITLKLRTDDTLEAAQRAWEIATEIQRTENDVIVSAAHQR
jgi:hypothetical protein